MLSLAECARKRIELDETTETAPRTGFSRRSGAFEMRLNEPVRDIASELQPVASVGEFRLQLLRFEPDNRIAVLKEIAVMHLMQRRRCGRRFAPNVRLMPSGFGYSPPNAKTFFTSPTAEAAAISYPGRR